MFPFAQYSMEKKMRIINEATGIIPYTYRKEKSGRHNQEVWVRRYQLVTDDWFEVGFAYSLHLDKKRAEKYRTPNWWAQSSYPEKGYVTKQTLERIMKDEKKVVFSSWENGC